MDLEEASFREGSSSLELGLGLGLGLSCGSSWKFVILVEVNGSM